MAITLYLRSTANHVGSLGSHGNFDLENTAGTTANQSIGANTPRTFVYYSATTFPNLLDWQTGTYTWYLDVTVANANVQLTSIKLSRYDSTLSTEKASDTGTPNLTLNTTGIKTGTISFASPNPANRAIDDLLVVTITISKLSGGGTQSVTIHVNGSGDSRLDTPLSIPVVKDITEDAVSIGAGSVDTTKLFVKPISEDSISIGAGSVVGAKLYSVSISESSVSVGAETVERERETDREITESPTVYVSDSLEKAATYSKPISNEDSISISDSIARETDNYRSIDDSPSVSISEGLEGTKLPSGPTAKLFDVHFVEFPEDILDTIEIEALGARVQADKTHKWNIIEKITATKTHVYNVSNAVSTTKTHKFNLSNAVTTTKTHLYNVIAKVTTTKTHKYNLAGQASTTKTHKWNIIQTISTTKTHRYNINIPTTQVSTTKTHLYHVIEKISTSKTHKYDLEGLIVKSVTHKYHIFNAVSTTKTHPYSILERISASKTHKYNILSVVEKTATHKYNIISRVTKSKTHLFSIIARISVSKTHIYRILEAIETVTKTHRYNILSRATSDPKTHKYNIIGHIIRTHTHRWDSGGKVSTTKIHKYNIGLAFEVPTGAGSATVAHIKFPPRVTIVDIIADIRNLAIANIELRPFDPKIICVGLVEINEEKLSPILIKTASGKARHRIASTLIIPQILDTIDNRAVSGRIAIEILQPKPEELNRIRSLVQLQIQQQICLTSHTQIKQREEDVIRLSSFTELGHKTHVASVSHLELGFLNNIIQLKTKEIMTIQREQLLRLLIDVLKSDDMFI